MDNAIKPPQYNLSEDSREFFQFSLKGHLYNFRYMSVEEVEAFREVLTEETKTREFLFDYITPVDKEAPTIEEAFKKMIVPEWRKFINMIKTELSPS